MEKPFKNDRLMEMSNLSNPMSEMHWKSRYFITLMQKSSKSKQKSLMFVKFYSHLKYCNSTHPFSLSLKRQLLIVYSIN